MPTWEELKWKTTKDSKDILPVHLILGARDYAKIKTKTALCWSPRMQKDGMRWGFPGKAIILPFPAMKYEVCDSCGTLWDWGWYSWKSFGPVTRRQEFYIPHKTVVCKSAETTKCHLWCICWSKLWSTFVEWMFKSWAFSSESVVERVSPCSFPSCCNCREYQTSLPPTRNPRRRLWCTKVP